MDTISQLRSVTCHMGSHSVTCHPTQVSTLRFHPSLTRFTYPGGMEGWVDQGDFVTYQDGLPAAPQTVTHPSTNRARCRLTSLIKPTPLTTTPLRHYIIMLYIRFRSIRCYAAKQYRHWYWVLVSLVANIIGYWMLFLVSF